eukprot:Hpha_TRINITY_DN632_c0_g1::TRINITY_DN632_c0_g1_i1::g.21225::m.21225
MAAAGSPPAPAFEVMELPMPPAVLRGASPREPARPQPIPHSAAAAAGVGTATSPAAAPSVASQLTTLSLSCSESTVAVAEALRRPVLKSAKVPPRPQTVLPPPSEDGSMPGGRDPSWTMKGTHAPMLPLLRSELSVMSYMTRRSDHGDAPEGSGVGWFRIGCVLYSFTMPTSVAAAGSAVGAVGLGVAIPLTIFLTASSAGGAWLVAQVAQPTATQPRCLSLGDVGRRALGGVGQCCGSGLQALNLLMLLPVNQVVLAFTIDSIVPQGGLMYTSNWSAAILLFLISLLQHLFDLSATFLSVFVACMVVLAAGFQVQAGSECGARIHSVPPLVVGNPDGLAITGVLPGLLGGVVLLWAYTPVFLSAELSSLVNRPRDFARSLVFSALLTSITIITVGWGVTSCWGWKVANPVTSTPGWVPHPGVSFTLLAANLASYSLHSSCLSRAGAKWLADSPAKEHRFKTILRRLVAGSVLWGVGTFVAWLLPRVQQVVSVATLMTVPSASFFFPAVCYAGRFMCSSQPPTRLADVSSRRMQPGGLPQIQVEEATPLVGSAPDGMGYGTRSGSRRANRPRTPPPAPAPPVHSTEGAGGVFENVLVGFLIVVGGIAFGMVAAAAACELFLSHAPLSEI